MGERQFHFTDTFSLYTVINKSGRKRHFMRNWGKDQGKVYLKEVFIHRSKKFLRKENDKIEDAIL